MARNNGKTGDKKTVTDLKRGMAVDDHQIPVDGDGRGAGDNSFDPSGETLDEFFSLQDQTDDRIDELKEKMRLMCEPIRAKIKDIKGKVKEARDQLVKDGYPTLELNVMSRQRRLRRQADKATAELDAAQKRRHAEMERAWQDFRALPLGAAAEAREAATQH